jgi:thioredoxin 1
MITVKRFTASWCAPCKMLAPVIKSLEPAFPDVTFETVDIDSSPEVASEYHVRSVPTVVIMKDGAELERIVGALPKQKYIDAINNASA